MSKGIVYIMTSCVSGLIKIGKCQTKQFAERMRDLESNGYYNVSGLKIRFAIEVQDYDEKEKLLDEVFSKHRVADSELFALEPELVEQLLLAFDGKVIYPENLNREKQFNSISKTRIENKCFNFYEIGIKDGEKITFRYDESKVATVISEREVEYQEQTYKLSPLTRQIMEDMGKGNESGVYQGSQYWCYNGERLAKLRK